MKSGLGYKINIRVRVRFRVKVRVRLLSELQGRLLVN